MRQKIPTRILIVDADELSLALIRASLETQDYSVFSAFNCGQALNVAAKESLDLVICDCDMRANTGVTVETLVHSVPANCDVPFLFMSSTQESDVISRPSKDRNVFFIRKPFDHEAFLELVEYAMWMPTLIRSHIERIHQQQGLRRPHSAPNSEVMMPYVLSPPAFGIMPIVNT